MITPEAVSYTHLDVYKRQFLFYSKIFHYANPDDSPYLFGWLVKA